MLGYSKIFKTQNHCFSTIFYNLSIWKAFPGVSGGKDSACKVGSPGSFLMFGKSPGEGNGYPLHYSCLERSMDRGTWWATVHGVAKSWTWLTDKHSSIWKETFWTHSYILIETKVTHYDLSIGVILSNVNLQSE